MRTGEWTLRGLRVVTPDGTRAADVVIRGETIAAVLGHEDPDREGVILDVGDLLVLPGLVDLHVHVHETGRAEWEGFETATRAAAAGGVTTMVDMPVSSSPVTTSPRAFAAKLASADRKLWVDCGFHGGLVPGNIEQVEPMLDAGALGIQASLCPSAVEEFAASTEADLRAAMPLLARLGRPLLVRAELVGRVHQPRSGSDRRSYAAHVAAHPPEWEVAGIRLLIDLCREYRCRVHVVQHSASDALPMIAAARAEGLPISVETSPHHLALAAEEIPDGDPRFKCEPPIRDSANRDRLWDGLRSGLIGTIASGHDPSTPEMKHLKSGDVRAAHSGISSLQLALPVVWTEARRRGFGPDDIARWMSFGPAEVVGLAGRKGSIAPDADADFVVLDPDATFVVNPDHLFHRHPITPYEGRTLSGRVEATILRGTLIFDSGRFRDDPLGDAVLRLEETLPILCGLERLNRAGEADVVESLRRCCASTRWAWRMAALRPFRSEDDLLEAAGRLWRSLDRADRLEAFAAHPRFGDSGSLLAWFAETPGWSSAGQADLAEASDDLLEALIENLRAYERRFGYAFLLDASGKSIAEIHRILRYRLENEAAAEAGIAADQQDEITRHRLDKLLG